MTFARCALPWLVLAAALAGCNNQKPPEAPARFEQPNAVDFVCVDHGRVEKLDACTADVSPTDGIALHALVTQHSRGEVAAVNMDVGKVLDSRRDIPGYTFVPVGQLPIAIIVPPNHPDFTYVADFGSRDVRVLRTQSLVEPLDRDADVQVVPLMAASDAGVVPAAPTQMVLSPDEDALIVAVPDQGRVLWLPIVRCPGDDPGPCEDYGHIDTANIASIALAGSVDRIATDQGAAPNEKTYAKLCGFPEEAPEPAAAVSVAPAMLEAAPRPSGLAVDAFCIGDKPCTRRILVSDEALPLIHAIDIDAITPGSDSSDALLPPLVVGVATKAVAVTPRVPVAIGDDEDTQYVYAIDATDGSVLVTEHDRLINVNGGPNARANRIELEDARGLGSPPAAVALSVIHPLFDVGEPAGDQYVVNAVAPAPTAKSAPDPNYYCTDNESHTMENPARLRGVFLTVATSDGGVHVVDVHDMELLDMPTKTADGQSTLASCRPCPNKIVAPVAIRNHERIGYNFITEEGADPIPLTLQRESFAFYVDGLGFNIRPDGTNGSPDAPSLDCIACDKGRGVVFPLPSDDSETDTATDADGGVATDRDICTGETPALLCANDDPWNASEEQWTLGYESAIPGTYAGDALFIAPDDAANLTGAAPEVVAGMDFCATGVLGDEEIAAAFADESCDAAADKPVSDQLIIANAFLGEARLKQLLSGNEAAEAIKNCALAAKALADDPKLTIAFGIRRAYSDRLVIDEHLLNPIEGLSTYADVQRCLGGAPMTFQVRTRKSFAVVGDLSGFAHNVKADKSGRCVVDPKANPLHRGRARLGCTFRNHAFTVRPRKPAIDDAVSKTPPGVTLSIRMSTPALKLVCDLSNVGYGSASVVPVQMHYSDVDRFLYLIDIQDRGLVAMPLDPFQRVIDPSQTFN